MGSSVRAFVGAHRCIDPQQPSKEENSVLPKLIQRQNAYTGYLSIDRLQLQLADGATVWREVEQANRKLASQRGRRGGIQQSHAAGDRDQSQASVAGRSEENYQTRMG